MPDEIKKYPFTCPVCGEEQSASTSIFQDWGYDDRGAGHCRRCRTFLHLTVDREKGIMLPEEYDDYAKRRLIEKEAKTDVKDN